MLTIALLILGLTASVADTQETAHLKLTTSVTAGNPAAGKKATLTLDVDPKPGIHVYAPGQKDYIVITLTLDATDAFTAAKAKYPAGERFMMPALNETQLVYSRAFRITQDITFKSKPDGPVTIKGRVRYQACTDKICFIPQTVAVSWLLPK